MLHTGHHWTCPNPSNHPANSRFHQKPSRLSKLISTSIVLNFLGNTKTIHHSAPRMVTRSSFQNAPCRLYQNRYQSLHTNLQNLRYGVFGPAVPLHTYLPIHSMYHFLLPYTSNRQIPLCISTLFAKIIARIHSTIIQIPIEKPRHFYPLVIRDFALSLYPQIHIRPVARWHIPYLRHSAPSVRQIRFVVVFFGCICTIRQHKYTYKNQ